MKIKLKIKKLGKREALREFKWIEEEHGWKQDQLDWELTKAVNELRSKCGPTALNAVNITIKDNYLATNEALANREA